MRGRPSFISWASRACDARTATSRSSIRSTPMDGIDLRPGGAHLLSLASAVPPHRMNQSDAAQMACKVFSGRFGNYDRMAPVFETAGIRTRYTVEPAEWYLSGKL